MTLLSCSVHNAVGDINIKANGFMDLLAKVNRIRLEGSDLQHINESAKLN